MKRAIESGPFLPGIEPEETKEGTIVAEQHGVINYDTVSRAVRYYEEKKLVDHIDDPFELGKIIVMGKDKDQHEYIFGRWGLDENQQPKRFYLGPDDQRLAIYSRDPEFLRFNARGIPVYNYANDDTDRGLTDMSLLK